MNDNLCPHGAVHFPTAENAVLNRVFELLQACMYIGSVFSGMHVDWQRSVCSDSGALAIIVSFCHLSLALDSIFCVCRVYADTCTMCFVCMCSLADSFPESVFHKFGAV